MNQTKKYTVKKSEVQNSLIFYRKLFKNLPFSTEEMLIGSNGQHNNNDNCTFRQLID